jgi:hypothetical protein
MQTTRGKYHIASRTQFVIMSSFDRKTLLKFIENVDTHPYCILIIQVRILNAMTTNSMDVMFVKLNQL